MSAFYTPSAFTEPGTYVVTVDGEETSIDVDSLDYDGPDGSLRAWKNGAVVASFRWWQSIVRKD